MFVKRPSFSQKVVLKNANLSKKRNTHVIAISAHKKMGNLSSIEYTSANQQKTPQK